MNYQEILDFWFKETTPAQHFNKDDNFDALIKERFLELHTKVAQGEYAEWRQTIHGRLAEIIVLDQFSRNLFRDKKESFAFDGMALILAQEAIETGKLDQLTVNERGFLYMPFMHSESVKIHEEALRLFSEEGLENQLDFEERHFEIIKRFSRYPHRNEILDRVSTQEEISFLKEPGSSF